MSDDAPTTSENGDSTRTDRENGDSTRTDRKDDRTVPGAPAEPASQSFGWRGWVLVGALVLSLIVIPWVIIYLPEAQGLLSSLGLGLRDAYLVLPLFPAIGLAGLAVWSAVASRRDRANQQ